MIDLHAHVLPGLDDGPATMAESLALLQAMADQGVTHVAASAHALDGRYNATRDAVLRATEAVNEALHAFGISVHVFPSMELFLGYDLLGAVKRRETVGLNDSHYLVVELPHSEYPHYTDRALFELMMAGCRPVLIHPERNLGIQCRPERMERLAEHGVLAMVTAASLLGRFGKKAQELGRRFLADGTATLVMSDAHDLRGRTPRLPEGLAAARQCGKVDQAAEISLLHCVGLYHVEGGIAQS